MVRSIEAGHAGTAVLAALLAYFVVYATAALTGDATLAVAAEVLFGAIAVLLGLVLVRAAPSFSSLTGLAGGALFVGGCASLAWLVTRYGPLDALGTVLVVGGIVGYLLAVWRSRR